MPDCEYCASSFDDEDAYLEHLGAEHRSELGPIDRRRVEQREGDEGAPAPLVYAAVVLGVLLVAAVGFLFLSGNGGGGAGMPERDAPQRVSLSDVSVDGVEAEQLPSRGDDALLGEVKTYPKASDNTHVANPTYDSFPPVNGQHRTSTVRAGFYTGTPRYGDLVHSLEHGAVVVYYDPAKLTPAARESLQEYAKQHQGHWSSVVVVENPSDDPQAAYVVTAWRTSTTMQEYDAQRLQAFLAEYLGRGPENPVR